MLALIDILRRRTVAGRPADAAASCNADVTCYPD
jgi:hypothetical protein